jgi:hypothetical protein
MVIEYFRNSVNHLNLELFILKQEYLKFVLFTHIGWWLVYGVIHFFTHPKLKSQKLILDTKNRYVSIIHAVLIFWLSIFDTLYYQKDECGQTNTEFQNYILLTTFSYFLYDLIACIILNISDKEMVLHHISCIVGSYMGVSYNNSANEMIRALVVTEISCPIMHLRMILKNYDLKHTMIHLVLDYTYMILYLIARMIYGSKNAYFTLFCLDNLLLVKITGGFIWIQSVIFSKRMVSLLKHKYLEGKERKQKGIELYWFSVNKKIEELEYYKRSLKKAAYVP